MHGVCLQMCPGCRTQKHRAEPGSGSGLGTRFRWLHRSCFLLWAHHPLPARSSPEAPPARDGICFSYHSFFFPSSTSSLCLCWSSGQQQSDESNSSTQKQPRVPVGMAMVVCSSTAARQCWRRGQEGSDGRAVHTCGVVTPELGWFKAD